MERLECPRRRKYLYFLLRLIEFICEQVPRYGPYFTDSRTKYWTSLSRVALDRILTALVRQLPCRVLSMAYQAGLLTTQRGILRTVGAVVSRSRNRRSRCLRLFLQTYERKRLRHNSGNSSTSDDDISISTIDISDSSDNEGEDIDLNFENAEEITTVHHSLDRTNSPSSENELQSIHDQENIGDVPRTPIPIIEIEDSTDDEDIQVPSQIQTGTKRECNDYPEPGPSGLQNRKIPRRYISDTDSDDEELTNQWEKVTDRTDKRLAMAAYWDIHYEADRQAHMPRNSLVDNIDCCSEHSMESDDFSRSVGFDREEHEIYKVAQIDPPSVENFSADDAGDNNNADNDYYDETEDDHDDYDEDDSNYHDNDATTDEENDAAEHLNGNENENDGEMSDTSIDSTSGLGKNVTNHITTALSSIIT